MSRFLNKVAIVTGSSNGIGQATAVLLAAEGASVTIHGRSLDGLNATEKLIQDKEISSDRILSIQGEIENERTVEDLVKKTFEKFGKIDVLINSAGLGGKPGMDRNSMEAYEYIHEINVKSILKLNNFVEPYLEKTKGNIVNVSSIAGILPRPATLPYGMSKASLDHYMRSMTHELAKKGIRINNVNSFAYKKPYFSSRLDRNKFPSATRNLRKRPGIFPPRLFQGDSSCTSWKSGRDRQSDRVPRKRRRVLRDWSGLGG
ncbi:hypothetical protein L596_016034 [Steinernema carpocapsae]|uniref:Uncharacterized protein n=1 Tax=Steinernema carpocapsae TaxID=34508 RepID=A0A4U5NGT3_STECR|nr:hypothetical protein L596_016034 [Steinernema carpocapsae]